jgi:hypothetical protein
MGPSLLTNGITQQSHARCAVGLDQWLSHFGTIRRPGGGIACPIDTDGIKHPQPYPSNDFVVCFSFLCRDDMKLETPIHVSIRDKNNVHSFIHLQRDRLYTTFIDNHAPDNPCSSSIGTVNATPKHHSFANMAMIVGRLHNHLFENHPFDVASRKHIIIYP